MKGQLWQECVRCGLEPVCVDCEKCADHCTCKEDALDAAQTAALLTEFARLQKLHEHHEQGRQEH